MLKLVHSSHRVAAEPKKALPPTGAPKAVRSLEELTPAERVLRSTPDSLLNNFPWESISVVCEDKKPATRDSIAFATGPAELRLRRIIKEFGFNRMPTTYGELRGLLDYCALLETAAGFTFLEENSENLRIWQKTAKKVWAKYHPDKITALQCYLQKDYAGLLDFHIKANLMETLGAEADLEEDEK